MTECTLRISGIPAGDRKAHRTLSGFPRLPEILNLNGHFWIGRSTPGSPSLSGGPGRETNLPGSVSGSPESAGEHFGIHGGAESGPGNFRNPAFAILGGPGPQFESSILVGWFNARNPQPFGGSVAGKCSNLHSSEGFRGHPSRKGARPPLTKPPGRIP